MSNSKRQRLGLDWRTIYQLAAEADVSHHTVVRALRGKPIAGAAGHRLAAVMQAHAEAYGLPIRTQVKAPEPIDPEPKRTA